MPRTSRGTTVLNVVDSGEKRDPYFSFSMVFSPPI